MNGTGNTGVGFSSGVNASYDSLMAETTYMLDFRLFCAALAIFTDGPLSDRMKFAFDIYNVDDRIECRMSLESLTMTVETVVDTVNALREDTGEHIDLEDKQHLNKWITEVCYSFTSIEV